MLGRGLVADPGMLTEEGTTRETLEAFLDELSQTYCVLFGSKRTAIYRLKDNWHFLIALFEDSEKDWKELRKTTDYDRFCAVSDHIIRSLPLQKELEVTW